MNGHYPAGRVVIFDDDHYYMGSVIAEELIELGCQVDFVSTFSEVATWARHTVEQRRTQASLMNLTREMFLLSGKEIFLEFNLGKKNDIKRP